MSEVIQAKGSRVQLLYVTEASWGTFNTAGTARALRLIGGSSLQPNFAIYKSNEIRSDRMDNQDLLGTERPDFSLPFELSPQGWCQFLYHLLGGTPAVTAGPVNEVQTMTILGTPTGGTFKLSYKGQTTAAITYSATSATVVTNMDAALEALSTIGTGNIATATTSQDVFTLTGGGATAGSDLALIQVVDNSLTGGTAPQIYIDVTTTGVPTGATRHVVKGSVALPVGFSLEQGHLDLASSANPFFALLGCRVNTMTLNFNIDQPIGGTLAGLARQALGPSPATLYGTSAPSTPTDDPFTSVQVAVLEGSTRRVIAIAEQATLSVSNNFDTSKGFALGSNLRQTMQPGSRTTTGTLQLMFQDSDLISKAANQTNTSIKFLCANSTYSIEFLMSNVRIQPTTGIWPVPADGGPISLNANFKASKDPVTGTDLQVTMVIPEADLTA